ncbi:unnamed protein product [Triticum turgidum subsp. durum]|uniref:PITH domain-containing protein n=1 Tax=Triticum turgidum subsp. durum TaxID=4567 RepID=A0A9R0VIT8_TRITD|nr:unnamed protein product [Triticum turgidum subsp. durum]
MACLHDHECGDHNCAADWSLYNHIDIPKVVALNESVAGSVKSVFKSWDQRLETSVGFLESNEGDPELLVFIPIDSFSVYRNLLYGESRSSHRNIKKLCCYSYGRH